MYLTARSNLVQRKADLSIDLDLLRYVNKIGGFVCGGFPRSILYDEPGFVFDWVTDVDIYPGSRIAKQKLIEVFKRKGELSRKSSISHTFKTKFSCVEWQIIDMVFDSPYHVIDSFDFHCCKFFLSNDCETVVGTAKAFEDTKNRIITISEGWDHPLILAYRVNKYILKGFRLNSADRLKLISLLECELENEESVKIMHKNASSTISPMGAGNEDDMFNDISDEAYKKFVEAFKLKVKKLKLQSSEIY